MFPDVFYFPSVASVPRRHLRAKGISFDPQHSQLQEIWGLQQGISLLVQGTWVQEKGCLRECGEEVFQGLMREQDEGYLVVRCEVPLEWLFGPGRLGCRGVRPLWC